MSYPAQEGRNPLATAHTTPPESTQFASSASIHPAASKIPEPTPAEYDRLKKDISEHGVRIAVVMTDDGRILDGRSRVKACTELGIKCPTRTATPDEMLDPMAASKSLNAHRRHLSADQIDQLLATYIMDNAHKVEADQQAAKAAQRAGLKKGTARGVDGHLTGKTSAKIAKDTGMSEDAVKRALKIKKLAPERLEEVAAGNVSAKKVLEEVKPTEPATKASKVVVTASRHGRQGIDTFKVAWTEADGAEVVQAGFRTLEEALAFCPCSMDPDQVERVVVPGVMVSNPVPRGMCGHNGSYMMLDGKKVPGSEVPPNPYVPEDEDQEEDEPTTEPTVNKVKAPTNEQPVPKKYKPGSPKWFESRLSDFESIAYDLRDQAAVSKLTRNQRERVAKAIEDIQHFERIAQDPVRVREVAFTVVKLWNESGGVQIETEGKYSKYTMQQVREAVACELNLDRWTSAIKEMTRIGGEWVRFTDLIIVRDGKSVGLEWAEKDLRQWVADEAAEAAGSAKRAEAQ